MTEQTNELIERACLHTSDPCPENVPGRWFVAHTRSRQEKILTQELSRYGIFSYLPLARRTTRSVNTGRLSESLVPVFPGYVFFKGSDEQRYLALTTNRVANVLTVPNQQQLVTELRQVHQLLAGADEFDVVNRLTTGDWVRITGGPLVGLEGVITSHAGRLRVWVNVTILGQSVSAEVDRHQLEPIQSS